MATFSLMLALTLLMVMIGNYFGGNQGMLMMLIISVGMNFFTYWNSDKIVLAQYRARQVDERTAPGLYAIVKRLTERAQMPMPKLYVVDDPQPNAFATGRNADHAAVCVTTGLANMLTRPQIAGVLGHELTHIRNHDILIGTVAATMAGMITTISRLAFWFGGSRDSRNNNNAIVGLLLLILGPIAAMIIQLAISRSREYKADEGGGRLCGNPDDLAEALLEIDRYAKRRTLGMATEATAHMFIISPFSKQDLKAMFSTHPTTEDRVNRLHALALEMKAKGELITHD